MHVYRDLQSNAIVLKPFDVQPAKATLLNTGQELETSVDMLPWYYAEKPYLRIRQLPVNELTETVMVIKLEFDDSICE